MSQKRTSFIENFFFRFSYSFKVKWIIFLCSSVSLYIAISLVKTQAHLFDMLTQQEIAVDKMNKWNDFSFRNILYLWRLKSQPATAELAEQLAAERQELKAMLHEMSVTNTFSLYSSNETIERALQSYAALLAINLDADLSQEQSYKSFITLLHEIQMLMQQNYARLPHIDELSYLLTILLFETAPETQHVLTTMLFQTSDQLEQTLDYNNLQQARAVWLRVINLMKEGGVFSSLPVAEILNTYVAHLQETIDSLDQASIGSLLIDTSEVVKHIQVYLAEIFAKQRYLFNLRDWIGGGVILLGILVVLTVYFTRVMRRPLEDIRQAAIALANGNLNARVSVVTNDEVASIGKAFNQMANFCQHVIGEVNIALEELSKPSMEMISFAKASETNVLNQHNFVQQIAAHTQKIWDRGAELQMSLDQVRRTASQTAELAKSGRQSLIEMESVLNVIGDAAERLVQALTMLQQKTLSIHEVINVILSVADQATLLSINTALRTENHRLHQSGFGVIAKKIADLANQIGSSALKLEEELRKIANSLTSTLEAVKKFTEGLRELVTQARLSRETLKTHIEEGQQQLILFEQISQNVHVQVEEAFRIHETIQHLAEVAQMTTESIKQFSGRINALYEDTQTLRALIARFHVSPHPFPVNSSVSNNFAP